MPGRFPWASAVCRVSYRVRPCTRQRTRHCAILLFSPEQIRRRKEGGPRGKCAPPGAASIFLGGALYALPIYLCEKKDGSKTPSKINLPGWQTRSLVVVREEGGEGVAKGGKIFTPRVANEMFSSSYAGGWQRVANFFF